MSGLWGRSTFLCIMRHRHTLPLILAAAVWACSGEQATSLSTPPPPPPPPPPAPAVLLREIVVPNLPSPYYHFEYDSAGRVKVVSFASELRSYEVMYDGNRLSEMRSSVPANGDTLRYSYDDTGRVSTIRYVDSKGVDYTVLSFSYVGQQLVGISRSRRIDGGGFATDKTVSLSYHADGNLRDLIVHRPSSASQQDPTTTTDHFEQYDDRINVDGFDLIHDEFFDNVFLLPGVQLQKGNPARQTHTGDGQNFTVDYTYRYDGDNRPLSKRGDLTILNGSDAGRRFQTSSLFSYY